MLSVKEINLATERYGTAYECVVGFQVGDASYNSVKVKLTPEATREIVNLIVRHATETLTVVAGDIRVVGEPLPLIEDVPIPDHEFDEVPDVAPVPAFLDNEKDSF